jgi:uncharacterized protein (TIGR02145 family)
MQKRIILIMFLLLTTIIYSQNPCPDIPTVNYAGKIYNTVQIGTQCWLKENLDVGTMIEGSLDQTNNGTIEKFCYNNDPNNCSIYGGLYQWNEAMAYSTTPGTKGICPAGWHIPTKTEFSNLGSTVNHNTNELKAMGQGSESGVGTNASGFSALAAGSCSAGGTFAALGLVTDYLTSTEFNMDQTSVNTYNIFFGVSYNAFYVRDKKSAYSIRCLKDAGTSSKSDDEEGIPSEYSLSQNYPNPFNPTTTIKYSVPKSQFVSLKVFDELGRVILTLVNENRNIGSYEIIFDASSLTSGVYFYQLQSGNYSETKKLLLIK